MKVKNYILSIVICSGCIALISAGCKKSAQAVHDEHPAEVVKIEGSELSRVTLSKKAVERLDLQTDQVRELNDASFTGPRKTVPYSSLIYDTIGRTWVYTNPQPRTFVRQLVQVDYIDEEVAILKDGPPVGTIVASVGVAELYGAEFEVGH